MTTRLPVIETLDALRGLVAAHGARLYVRYSRGPALDLARGYSLDHAAGQAHAGLSAEPVVPAWATPETVTDADLATQLRSYAYLLDQGGAGTVGWLCVADSEGRDSDGAPLLVAATVRPLAQVGAGLLAAARAIETEQDRRLRGLGRWLDG